MIRYILKDMQAVLRGAQIVAQNAKDHQLTEAAMRWHASSLRPMAQSVVMNLQGSEQQQQNGSPFNPSDIPSRIGAVVEGVQQQLKIVMGINLPSLVTPEGFVYFSDKYDKDSKEYPVTDEVSTDKASLGGAAAVEAAKRAREFMNPPVSPMDPVGINKDDVVIAPDTVSCPTNLKPGQPGNPNETTGKNGKGAKDDSDKMSSTIINKNGKTFIDSGDFHIEEVAKVNKVPPGTPVALDG